MNPAYDLERVQAASEQLQAAISAASAHEWPQDLARRLSTMMAELLTFGNYLAAKNAKIAEGKFKRGKSAEQETKGEAND